MFVAIGVVHTRAVSGDALEHSCLEPCMYVCMYVGMFTNVIGRRNLTFSTWTTTSFTNKDNRQCKKDHQVPCTTMYGYLKVPCTIPSVAQAPSRTFSGVRHRLMNPSHPPLEMGGGDSGKQECFIM